MSGHHHVSPLKPKPTLPAEGALPGNRFGALVGEFNHSTLSANDGTRADDNHIFLWLDVLYGTFQGKYECAFNTESNRTRGEDAEVLYYDHAEDIAPGDFPSAGFFDAKLSYDKLGLKDGDFQPIVNGALRSHVMDWAGTCELVAVYGVTYKEGTGIHDVHRNDDRAEDQDGALAFYYHRTGNVPVRHWVFIRFRNQSVSKQPAGQPAQEEKAAAAAAAE